MLHCGIVGLPLSGKTTLFNVITRAGAEVKPYPGGKTDPNRAVVSVPDWRFDMLAEHHNPRKRTPAQVEFVDLAGLSRDASKGAGLGNSFLSFVAEADALLHVVRGFSNPSVEHPEGSVDVLRDYKIVNLELIYRDLGVIENRLGRLGSKKKLSPEEQVEKELLERCQESLLSEVPIGKMGLSQDELRLLRGFSFLSAKPQMVVLNLDETQRDPRMSGGGRELLEELGEEVPWVSVYGQLEMDLLDLSPEEAAEFTAGLNISEPGRDRVIRGAYSLLGLISFFTCGPDEVRAWTLRDGATAVDAAGAIHSDLARGFIKAQVVSFEDYRAHGFSIGACRDAGCLRLEGKEYRVKDGDVIEIRFNV
ncbi:LOW QUALITY PROTEIN: GTP-binding protein YchF [Thermanaerovibrio velox DSM 12556]|uniref:Ribosome-binding ATPase YchF n=2 Tax=Thermanaerovibrio TaxID=81461 RepID=H0UNB3_9BACT|nr:LOW QUALITY PROTEIN: GTP-binding protein YchF [Thermanaerovibrio velox DSM 12556]